MSHHFDSTQAKNDPRLNLTDMYVFEGASDSTVLVMTANPDTGLSSPDVLHEEAIYTFRVQQGSSPTESLAFKFRFGAPEHLNGDEHAHSQRYRVILAKEDEMQELKGQSLLEGETGKAVEMNGVRAFVGTAPELWAADAVSFRAFMTSIWEGNKFDLSMWEHKQNFFDRRNTFAIVLEVPNHFFAAKQIRVWANVTLFGHAAEVQVSRYGLPLMTHLFLTNPIDDRVDDYHRHDPKDDLRVFGSTVGRFVDRVVSLARSAKNPEQYADEVVARMCPCVLPYELGSKASFTVDRFNGRPLVTDALDVMFSLAANMPIADGVSPDTSRAISSFPYYGRPFNSEEQADLQPIPHDNPGKKAAY